MTSPRRTTDALLAEWGERARSLPPHLAMVRDATLARVGAASSHPPVPYAFLRLPWLSLTCAGLAILILFIRIPVPPPGQSTAVPLDASKTTLREEVREEAAAAPEYAPTAGVRLERMDAPMTYSTATGLSADSAREAPWLPFRYGLAAFFGLLALLTAWITWKRSHRH